MKMHGTYNFYAISLFVSIYISVKTTSSRREWLSQIR
nr:MAG TPA: hypothetical protein [Caudoviricetes sp.]